MIPDYIILCRPCKDVPVRVVTGRSFDVETGIA